MSNILELLKANKKREEEKRASSRIDTYKLKDGENVIRLLGSKDGGLPFKTYGQHFVKKDGEKMSVYLCTKQTHDEQCPICEAVYEGLARYKGDKAMENTINKMRSAKRYLWNGIVEGQEDKGVQLIELASTCFDQIQDRLIEHMDEGFGDPLSLEEGYPFVITRTGTGTDTKYTVSASPKRKKALAADTMGKLINIELLTERVDEARLLTTLNKANAVIGLPLVSSVPAIGYASSASSAGTGTHGVAATTSVSTTSTAVDEDLDSLLDEELKAAMETEFKPEPTPTSDVEIEDATTAEADSSSDLDDLDALLADL